jgi:hypothetical protein
MRRRKNEEGNTVPHLTSIDPEFDRLVKQTLPGMAHWAGTGPAGTTCEQCRFFGYSVPLRNGAGNTVGTKNHPKSCHRFFELMKQHGKPLMPSTPSCRHFEPRD